MGINNKIITSHHVTHYELTNHLGNVLSVITPDASDATQPAIERLTDYYPFGMEEPGRSYSAEGYRYGFNGKEKEDMNGAHIDFGARIYDVRVGRFFNVDPLFNEYPSLGTYVFCSDNPIFYYEVDGRGFNGGISFYNNSSETVVLGGVYWSEEDMLQCGGNSFF